jgi:transcriptional regulator with XRE-family HTH domain
MLLGELFRSRREALGMTLEEVADAAGSSKSYVWELENNRSYKLGITMAVRFSIALGIHINLIACAAIETERKLLASTASPTSNSADAGEGS